MKLFINIMIFLIILQGMFVITSKNSVTSVLYLIGCYVLSSFIFSCLGAEFLAIILVIIYVGAVAILFILVIMMLNLRLVEVFNTLVIHLPIGIFIGSFFLFQILYMIKFDFGLNPNNLNYDFYTVNWIFEVKSKSNLNWIAEVLYNYYFYLVWIAGLLLLLAMVGAISLTIEVEIREFKKTTIHSYGTTRRLFKNISYWKF